MERFPTWRTCLNCSSKLHVCCCEELELSEEWEDPEELWGGGAGYADTGPPETGGKKAAAAGCGNGNGKGSENWCGNGDSPGGFSWGAGGVWFWGRSSLLSMFLTCCFSLESMSPSFPSSCTLDMCSSLSSSWISLSSSSLFDCKETMRHIIAHGDWYVTKCLIKVRRGVMAKGRTWRVSIISWLPLAPRKSFSDLRILSVSFSSRGDATFYFLEQGVIPDENHFATPGLVPLLQ